MLCVTCAEKCAAHGGGCSAFEWGAENVANHQKVDHQMTIINGWWTCEAGHKVEPRPADAMRAAGVQPML